ncbi:unnamed protein product [Coffea canephora]|uniref:Uncharacterized protein n=1 Tax=Coffea canephora TaxID=49390 RepID=A0A068V2Z3_COFCA|nr:unnamed protein product [Coffea canephora]
MKSGQSVMDCQHYGSKIATSVATKEVDIGSTEPAGKLFSISAMPFYKDRSHEELRFEDSNQLLRSKDAASGFIFQSNQPSAGKTNAFLGPTAVTPHSQLKTSSAISIGSGPWTGNSTGFSYIGDQCRGSKIASYVATREVDIDSTEPAGKLFSISAMPIYKVKSHEELRFEDSHQFVGSKDAASGFIFQSNQPSAGKTNAFLGPTAVTPHSQLKTSSAISIGSGPWTGNSTGFSYIGDQCRGSKIASYVATREVDIDSTEPAGKLFSISAMPIYKVKSHEELRFEDSHQFIGSKDAASGFIFQSNQPSAGKTNAFLGPTAVTPHSQLKTSSAISIGSGPWTGNSTGFSYIGDQCRGSKIASYVATREVDIDSTEPAGKLFSISAMPIYKVKSHEELRFEDSHQFIGSKDAASGFIFQSNQPSAGKTNAFSGPTVVSLNSQPESLSAISTGTGLLMSNSSDFIWPNHEPITTPQITQIVVATDGASTSISQQSISTMDAGTCRQSGGMQQSECQSTIALDPSVVASPFGMESRIQISMGGTAATTTVQYGISCIPVSDKPAPVKRNSLLTTRCLSLSQNWPSVEKYRPKNDSQKVPFYEEKVPGIYKVRASFIPRENARSWVLNSKVERPLKTNSRNSSISASETGNFEAEPGYYTKPPVEEEPGFCRRVKDFVIL